MRSDLFAAVTPQDIQRIRRTEMLHGRPGRSSHGETGQSAQVDARPMSLSLPESGYCLLQGNQIGPGKRPPKQRKKRPECYTPDAYRKKQAGPLGCGRAGPCLIVERQSWRYSVSQSRGHQNCAASFDSALVHLWSPHIGPNAPPPPPIDGGGYSNRNGPESCLPGSGV